MARSEVPVPAVSKASGLFSYHTDIDANRFIPTVAFLRPDKDDLSALIGTDAIEALQQPLNQREIINSGYGNFRLQPKKDIVLDSDDDNWTFTRKKKFGEERITCETAVRELFRTLVKCLGENDLRRAHERPIYIGKPAFSESSLERRYVRRISAICSSLGFKNTPAFVYEPYAVMYYCQHLAGIEFQPPGKRRRTRVLIVDHGGGTLSTCIVELDSEGKIGAKATPVRPISLDDSGGRRLDEIILLSLIRRAVPDGATAQQLTKQGRPHFPLLDSALLSVEAAKIECVERNKTTDGDYRVRIKVDTGLPKHPAIEGDLALSDVRAAFVSLWDNKRKGSLEHTLRGESSPKIDYVIFAGGTCRTGFHKDLLEKHYAEFLTDGKTRFFDISAEKAPVAKGICYQALLDYAETHVPGEAVSEVAKNENLTDVVAQDLFVRLQSDHDGSSKARVLGSARIVKAGTPKSEVWDRDHAAQVSVGRRLPQRFRLGVESETSVEGDSEAQDASLVVIKKSALANCEKVVKAIFRANSEGIYWLQVAVAPSKMPNYLEPDHKRFHLFIPDLIKADLAKRRVPVPDHQVLGIDFGSAVSCLMYLDLMGGARRLGDGRSLSDEPPAYMTGVFSTSLVLTAQADDIDQQSRRLIAELSKVSTKVGDEFERFLCSFNDLTRPCELGYATSIRTCLEQLLTILATDAKLASGGITPVVPRGKKMEYSKAQRVSWIMKRLPTRHPKRQGNIEALVDRMVEVAYARASDIIHGDVPPERREIERILNISKAAMFELLCM